MLLQNAAKEWKSLGHWRSDLWAAELGMYYSNVYGKILFAALNILASVSFITISQGTSTVNYSSLRCFVFPLF